MPEERTYFYKMWHQLIQLIKSPKDRLAVYEAIFEYAFNGVVPQCFPKDAMRLAFDTARARIDATMNRSSGHKRDKSIDLPQIISSKSKDNPEIISRKSQDNLKIIPSKSQETPYACADTTIEPSNILNPGDNKLSPPLCDKKRFKKPTLEEVREYCLERGNGINPEAFLDFYESKGWMIGKNPMKDWRAAVRTWEQKNVKPRRDYTGI